MDEHKQMVTDCLNRQKKLDDWERGFMVRIAAQLRRKRPLSPAQEEILDRVWERVTA